MVVLHLVVKLVLRNDLAALNVIHRTLIKVFGARLQVLWLYNA